MLLSLVDEVQDMVTPGDWWTTKQLADLLRMSGQTVKNMRKADYGPPYVKIGKKIFYPRDLFRAWLDANLHQQFLPPVEECGNISVVEEEE